MDRLTLDPESLVPRAGPPGEIGMNATALNFLKDFEIDRSIGPYIGGQNVRNLLLADNENHE